MDERKHYRIRLSLATAERLEERSGVTASTRRTNLHRTATSTDAIDMSRTPLLIHPTLDEVKLQAAKIGLPPREAEKFWYHYDSVGWKVGRVPMKNWLSALVGWKFRWQDRRVEQFKAEKDGSANDVKRELGRWRKEK